MFGDVNGDGIKDIISTLDNEDGTKNLRITTLQNDKLKEIFSLKDNRGVIFAGEIIDGVKAHLRCGKFSKEMYVDLSDLKRKFLEEKKINESGKIICENKKVTTTKFNLVELVSLSNQCAIQTTQRICAFDDLSIIDEIIVIWKYENEKWQVVEAKGNRVGNLSY